MTIPTLINKTDNFELVLNQIAAILVAEVASQMSLATLAGEDPQNWNLRIFTDAFNPWEQFRDSPTAAVDRTPIVNCWWDNSPFQKEGSDMVKKQICNGRYNIDIYGYGCATELTAGHLPGDKDSALEAKRACRLVRNILMAAEYTYLSMRGTVAERWIESMNYYQPQIDNRGVVQASGIRIVFTVKFLELSPQVAAETLEYLSATINRKETGEVYAVADYDYT